MFLFAGKLELKIPWKNLYTQSVEATLDGVYLLIVPTASKRSICFRLNQLLLKIDKCYSKFFC